ncbi:MAG TPA: glycosyltransferase family 4 protein, partial [Nitrospirota bacterium]|nr:glycosyltransferase family 4 protein [Nitrospirota bacterium]
HRILPLYGELKSRGVQCSYTGVPRGAWGRILFFLRLFGTDLLVLHKKLFGPAQLWLIRLLCRKIIFDFDDAIMFVEDRWKKPVTGKYVSKFRDTVKASDAVVAGNEFLAAQARLTNEKVAVLTTPVDTAEYVPAGRAKRHGVTVGWIGMKGNLFYLEGLSDVFKGLARKYPDFSLSIICNDFVEFDGVRVNKRVWSEQDEARLLQELDIGVMPLNDDLWSRGKCGFKILQYFSVGIPVVASPVGINSDIVEHGVNGFLATSPDEWDKYLSALIGDEALRKRMGAAGRRTVEEKYSLERYMERYLSIIEGPGDKTWAGR